MVLEQLIATKWVEKRPWHAFLLGFVYSVIGIVASLLIFGSYPSYMAVALTALFILPSLNKLLELEENREIREKKLSIKLPIKDHWDIFEIYLFLFLGVMLCFSLFALALPRYDLFEIFDAQLRVAGVTGAAFDQTFETVVFTFINLLANNFKVLIVILILSLLYGAGSVLYRLDPDLRHLPEPRIRYRQDKQ